MSCCRTAGKPQNQPPSPDLPLVPGDAPAVGSYGSAGRIQPAPGLVFDVPNESQRNPLLQPTWLFPTVHTHFTPAKVLFERVSARDAARRGTGTKMARAQGQDGVGKSTATTLAYRKVTMECNRSADASEGANLQAFHPAYPLGENVVIAPTMSTAVARRGEARQAGKIDHLPLARPKIARCNLAMELTATLLINSLERVQESMTFLSFPSTQPAEVFDDKRDRFAVR